MTKFSKCLRFAANALAIVVLPVQAHHSHGNYIMTEYIQLEGTVSELLWINPHTWIYLEIAGDGDERTIWALEGGSPGALQRRGWEPTSVNAGDTISVRCHQLRDRSNGCLLGFVTPPGGEEKEWD